MNFPAFIPFHIKDSAILPYCIQSLRSNIRPKVGDIYVVSGDLPFSLSNKLKRLGVKHLHESAILADAGVTSWPIIRFGNQDRSGFYLQQFLKYEFRRYADSEYYLVADSDTIFVRPIVVLDGDKTVFYRTHGHHEPIFRLYERLLGYQPKRKMSFVVHFMAFRRRWLEALINEIRTKSGVSLWFDAVLASLERDTASGYSEYETYGYFVTERFPGFCQSRAVRSLTRATPRWPVIPLYVASARTCGIDTLSFHSYLRS